MNSKFVIPLFTSSLGALALLSCGCTRHGSDGHAGPAHAEAPAALAEGVTFKEGRGLLVPPSTAKFIGLKVEDVAERTVPATWRFTAEVFQAAASSQGSLLESSSPAQLSLATALVHHRDAQRLQKGQDVAVESSGGERLLGQVREIHEPLGTNSSQVEVIVAIADARRSLPHGASVSVSTTNISSAAVPAVGAAVPSSALLRSAEGTFVYTVSGERFVRTPVKTGAVTQDWAEITDGLYAGDQVVVHPVMSLWMAELQSIRGGRACTDGH